MLDNADRIRDKMQVVYKEMACDRAKFNVAKWNLIGRIQFKHVKSCLMLMYCNDWVCSDWTLDVVFVVRDEMYVVWRVRCEKRSEKTRFNFKNYTIEVNANLFYLDRSRPHSTRLLQRPQS